MTNTDKKSCFDTVVIGGGQAGLALGYYLARQKRDFVILDAQQHTGDSWRARWDSLRLFTPAWISGLPGMRIPGDGRAFLTKDEIAAYLESYATRFKLPIRYNTVVDSLVKENKRYLLNTQEQQIEAEHVVVATGPYQVPKLPPFASELDPSIVQLHSSEYRNPHQLRAGNTLIVGAGSSGAEIALELAPSRKVWLAGRDTGHRPKEFPPLAGQLYWFLIHRAINTNTPPGRRFKNAMKHGGAPLIGIPKNAFALAKVERTPRMVGVQDGRPQLEDGRVLSVTNVIWCTGFTNDYSWIHLPVFSSEGYPIHKRGLIEGEPGLYFLGLPFQYTLSSSFVGGVGRDAGYIARHIAQRSSGRSSDIKYATPVTA